MDRIARVAKKTRLGEKKSDLEFWLSLTPEERIRTLEEIREEYNQWKNNAEPRLQRVYKIIKRK
jgi:hypothetical protein